MNKMQIITDSTCDLSSSLTQGLNLEVMPLTITIGDRNYIDGEEIQVGDIYEFMRKGIFPKTSQIPYEKIYNTFKDCFEKGQDFIYIAFSSNMSGCYSLAYQIADELGDEYPERKYAVIDSRGGSGAMGLIVLQALRMARDGLDFETLKCEIEFMAAHVEHVFSVDDFEWLAKGGRVSKFVGFVGKKLGIHPILDVENGCITKIGITKGYKRVIKTVADEIALRAKLFPTQLIAITHADDLASANMLKEFILEKLPEAKTTISHIGGVIGVHIGLKGIGAYCFNRKPKNYICT